MININQIDEIIKENGWTYNPDKLFKELLKYMLKYKLDIGKEYQVRDFIKILDELKLINDSNSYNNAKKVMFSTVNGRDYFIFNNSDIQDNLTDILRKKRNGFEWRNYNEESVCINPQYKIKIVAGSNELKFKEMLKVIN